MDNKFFALGVLVLVVLVTGCIQTTINEPVYCTEDVYECPNGIFVDRDPGNNCAFYPCPAISACTKELKACPDGSSVGRNPTRNCEFDPCPPAPPGTVMPDQCEQQGGYVIYDIGDGKVHVKGCPRGQIFIGTVPVGIEGGICCKR